MNDGPAAQSAAAAASPDAVALNEKSIAVLPFVDLSPAKDQEYFSDGLAEELLNLLAKLPELRVTSRSSAFAFKGQTLAMSEIAKRLNVAHVLEGSVRKAGNRVRVTAQLIEAHTDRNLWSEYLRPRPQRHLCRPGRDQRGGRQPPESCRCLATRSPRRASTRRLTTCSCRARQFARLHTTEGYEKAVELYTQGLAIDGEYAPAWTVLAYCYRRQANNSMRPLKAGYALARDALTRALKIDPEYAPAYGELSRIALDFDGDRGGRRARPRARDRARPDERGARLSRGALAQTPWAVRRRAGLGRLRARTRSAESRQCTTRKASDFACLGRPDEALGAAAKVLELSPGRHQRALPHLPRHCC